VQKWADPFVRQVAEFERELLIKALIDANGNVAKAGRISGQLPTTMWMKVKKFGLNPKSYRIR